MQLEASLGLQHTFQRYRGIFRRTGFGGGAVDVDEVVVVLVKVPSET